MLPTLLLHDEAMIEHEPGRGHPERPDRLRAIVNRLDESPVAEAPDWSEAPELKAEQGETARILKQAIDELPLDYRAPLVLRDIEGLSTREAAEVMELGEAAFKSRLHRARMAVRHSLDKHFADAD